MKQPTTLIVDNYLPNPDTVRQRALKQRYLKQGSAGLRSDKQFLNVVRKFEIEHLLRIKIPVWDAHPMNARFQFCVAKDPLVHHSDSQRWAGTLFLTPNAPFETGLTLLRSRHNGKTHCPTKADAKMYGDHFDRTLWDQVDQIGNRYNRLVLWDARHAHTPTGYFGTNIGNCRLFMVFFFDGDPIK